MDALTQVRRAIETLRMFEAQLVEKPEIVSDPQFRGNLCDSGYDIYMSLDFTGEAW